MAATTRSGFMISIDLLGFRIQRWVLRFGVKVDPAIEVVSGYRPFTYLRLVDFCITHL